MPPVSRVDLETVHSHDRGLAQEQDERRYHDDITQAFMLPSPPPLPWRCAHARVEIHAGTDALFCRPEQFTRAHPSLNPAHDDQARSAGLACTRGKVARSSKARVADTTELSHEQAFHALSSEFVLPLC